MEIYRSVDIEDVVRTALAEHMTAYCPPLPAEFETPCISVTHTGGDTSATASGKGKVDRFVVVLDARAETHAEASSLVRTAVAILEGMSGSHISYTALNSSYSWGTDPVRPDLAMCSATLMVTAHRETVVI